MEVVEHRREFSNLHAQSLYSLVRGEAVSARTDRYEKWDKPYTVYIDKVIEILEEEEISCIRRNVEIVNISDLVRQGFNDAIQALERCKVLSRELLNNLRRIVTISSIQVCDETFHRFEYYSEFFPANEDELGILTFGTVKCRLMMEDLEKIFRSQKINFNRDIITRVAIRWGISHELGHALYRTIVLLISEQRELKVGDYALSVEIKESVDQGIYSSADYHLAEELLKGEPSDGLHTQLHGVVTESFCRGIEYIGLEEALLDEGVSTSDVDKIIEEFLEGDRREFEDFQFLIREIHRKGLTLEAFCWALNDIFMALKRLGRQDVRDRLPASFGSQFLGYFVPLKRDQIETFLSKVNVI